MNYRVFQLSPPEKEWEGDLRWMIQKFQKEQRAIHDVIIGTDHSKLMTIIQETFPGVTIKHDPARKLEVWFGYLDTPRTSE